MFDMNLQCNDGSTQSMYASIFHMPRHIQANAQELQWQKFYGPTANYTHQNNSGYQTIQILQRTPVQLQIIFCLISP